MVICSPCFFVLSYKPDFLWFCFELTDVSLLLPQSREYDEGVAQGHDPDHPDRVRTGSVPACPAGGVHRTPRLPVEAAGMTGQSILER